jgi:hypothetical protein
MAEATRLLLCLLCLQVLLPSEAHAYLDPGTGSFVFQMIVASIVGAAVTLKMYWRQAKTFLLRRDRGANEASESDTSEPR